MKCKGCGNLNAHELVMFMKQQVVAGFICEMGEMVGHIGYYVQNR